MSFRVSFLTTLMDAMSGCLVTSSPMFSVCVCVCAHVHVFTRMRVNMYNTCAYHGKEQQYMYIHMYMYMYMYMYMCIYYTKGYRLSVAMNTYIHQYPFRYRQKPTDNHYGQVHTDVHLHMYMHTRHC